MGVSNDKCCNNVNIICDRNTEYPTETVCMSNIMPGKKKKKKKIYNPVVLSEQHGYP